MDRSVQFAIGVLLSASTAVAQFNVGPVSGNSAGPVGHPQNAVITHPYGGPPFSLTQFVIEGDLTKVNNGTFASEARIRITNPAGASINTLALTPITNYTGTIHVGPTTVNAGALAGGATVGTWTFQLFEAFDDAGIDQVWSALSIQVQGAADCNGNGIADAQDIAAGTSQDCNANGTPDECDLAPIPVPEVDGLAEALYGPALAVQNTQTGFGDNTLGLIDFANGSELDAGYAMVRGGSLYLVLAGNLESNFNKLDVFIDTGPGGQHRLRGDNAAVKFGQLNRMGDDGSGNGMTFDWDFFADYWFSVTGGGSPYALYANFAELPTNGGGAGDYLGQAGAGTSGSLSGGANPHGIRVTIDNRNVGGVTLGTGAASGAGVVTGIEAAIPLSAIGNPTGALRICAFINGSGHDYLSNQVLGGIAGGPNLTEPRTVDFSGIAGSQFFQVMWPSDCNSNGVLDECETDCNCNGVHDPLDIQRCDQASMTVGCANPLVEACVCNVLQACCTSAWDATCADIAHKLCRTEASKDCNSNGFPDECDIASGTSLDLNGDAVPDECIPCCCYGDMNGDGSLSLLDVVEITNCVGSGSGCDADCDGVPTMKDVDIVSCLVAGRSPGVCCADCCEQEAVFDPMGIPILPVDYDPAYPVTIMDVDRIKGYVDDLYPGYDTSSDTWYPNYPCDWSLGGEIPPEAELDLEQELIDTGITGVTPDAIDFAVSNWEQETWETVDDEPLFLPDAPGVTDGDWTPPTPQCTKPCDEYVFGGRDIIYVHGLKLDHIRDRVLGVPGALAGWGQLGGYPGPFFHPEFYRIGSNPPGYYMQVAECTWNEHINKFLVPRGAKNRYLIVSYSCADRLAEGVHAILTQIGDAMRDGTGVRDIDHPNGLPTPPDNFGAPGFVIVSHSTGGLVTDVAMHAAANYAGLRAQHIAQSCKAHIALDSVFSGSHLATLGIAASGLIGNEIGAHPWLCNALDLVIADGLQQYFPCSPPGGNLQCLMFTPTVGTSILVDLVPTVSQLRWGSAVENTPVKTVVVTGGHPTAIAFLKHIVHRGLDDGVSAMNSQSANPNSSQSWPSGYLPTSYVKVFDMGLWSCSHGIDSPKRASRYYVDQVFDHVSTGPLAPLGLPGIVACGPIPYVSPSGMVQPVGFDMSHPTKLLWNALNRYSNHFTYIASASDHFVGYNGAFGGFNGQHYLDTKCKSNNAQVPCDCLFVEPNFEETRVIRKQDESAFFNGYSMPHYPNDSQPLLAPGKLPRVQEVERGRCLCFTRTIPLLFGASITINVEWWIWKRVYHLLEGYSTKLGMDYVYDHILTEGGYPCCEGPHPCPVKDVFDCNANEMHDGCDIASGRSLDSNNNGIPDECEAIVASAVSRRSNPHAPGLCDTNLLPARKSEMHQGGISEVRIGFDKPPGGSGSGATLYSATCPTGLFSPNNSTFTAGISGNALVLNFSPALANAKTYRINLEPPITYSLGQQVFVRGLVGDVNGDGYVNALDRSTVVGCWTGGFTCPCDVNSSGNVDGTDRSIVVGAWTGGQNCAP